jgi:hypothetical protein
MNSAEQHLFMVHVHSEFIRDAAFSFKDTLVTYIPDNTYVLRLNASSAMAVSQLPQIKFVDVLPHSTKLSSRLRTQLARQPGSVASELDGTFVDVEPAHKLVFPSVTLSEHSSPLSTSPRVPARVLARSSLHEVVGNIDVSAPAHHLHTLSALRPTVTTVYNDNDDNTEANDNANDDLSAFVASLSSRAALVVSRAQAAVRDTLAAKFTSAMGATASATLLADVDAVDTSALSQAAASGAGSVLLPLATAISKPTSTNSNTSTSSTSAPRVTALSFLYQSPLAHADASALSRAVMTAAAAATPGFPLRTASTAPSAPLQTHVDALAATLAPRLHSLSSTSTSTSTASQRVMALAHTIAAVVDVQAAAVHNAVADIAQSIAELPLALYVDLKPKFVTGNLRPKFIATIGSDSHIPIGGDDSNNMYHAAGVSGTGITVGVADTGVDTKSCYFRPESGSIPFDSFDSSARKIVSYVTYVNGGDVFAGHGSHVVGSIAGNAVSGSSATATKSNGVAPDAKIAFYDIGDSSGSLYVPDDITSIFSAGAQAGAWIHSNSWGCGKDIGDSASYCNVYDSSSFYADQFMHDNPESLILFANGNDGIQYETVGTPATAKNILSVGALTSSYRGFVDAGQSASDDSYYSTDSLAYFSSLGPTSDGRTKPEVVSVGYPVRSARASGSSAQSCQTTIMSGTSMATPTTAGAAALLKDYLQQGLHTSPASPMTLVRGSLLKAALVASAEPVLYRGADTTALPTPMQTQTAELSGKDGNYLNKHLGEIIAAEDDFNSFSSAYYYFTLTTGATAARTLKMVMSDTCDRTYTLTYGPNLGSTTTTTTPASVTSPVTFEGITQRLYLKIDTTTTFSAACSLVFGLLEYDAPTYAAAPAAVDADCDDTVADWPSFDSASSALPSFRFACPAAPACGDALSSAAARGTHMYSPFSSICKAALHDGSVNATDASAAVSSADIAAWVAARPRSVVEVSLSIYNRPTNQYYESPGSSAHGVTSSTTRIFGQDLYWTGQIAGDVATPAAATVSAGDFNRLLSLPADNAPNPLSGYGKVTLASVAPLGSPSTGDTGVAPALLLLSDGADTLTHRSARVTCFTVSSSALAASMTPSSGQAYSPGRDALRVSLAWSDYPSAPAAANTRALVNDLDLFVFSPSGAETRGNLRVDRRQPVEAVSLPAAQLDGGLHCAAVHGAYVPLGAQPYALVAAGRGLQQCGPSPVPADVAITGKWTRAAAPSCTGPSAGDANAVLPAETEMLQAGSCAVLRPWVARAGACQDDGQDDAAGLFGLRRSACDAADAGEAETGAGGTASGAAWWASGSVSGGDGSCDGKATWSRDNDEYEACVHGNGTAEVTWRRDDGSECEAQYAVEEAGTDVQTEAVFEAQQLIPVPTWNAATATQKTAGVVAVIAAMLLM